MGSVSIQPASLSVARALAGALVLASSVIALSTFIGAEPAQAARRSILLRPDPQLSTPKTPRTILISIRKQRLRIFDGNREIASSRISSGMRGFDTPTGVFSILEKKKHHVSNIYHGAQMPYMQRLTWSGIALHAGVVPGYRASHGCIRLPHSFANSLFGHTDVGGRVIITQDEALPVSFEHSNLFKPLPENDPAPAQETNIVEARVAANDITAADRAALSSIVSTAAAAETAPEPQPQAAASKPRSRAEAQRMLSQRLTRLADELRAAEEKKSAVSDKAKAALRAAQDAEAAYKDVRRPFESVLRVVASAESAREAAARAYRDFLTQPSRRTAATRDGDVRTVSTAEDRELDLEDRLLDATVEADAAKAGAADAQAAVAAAKAAYETAEAEKQKLISEVQAAMIDLRAAQKALVDARAEVTRRNRQLAIFISLKTQRIYLRQGFEPILEAPIEIDEHPGAIGTHVLTAMDYDETGNDFVWQMVSAQGARPAGDIAGDDDDRRGKKKRKSEPSGVGLNSPLNIEAARVALDSVRVPQDVADMIAELARPGTSLIISEKEPSPRETGKGTEFVVLTR